MREAQLQTLFACLGANHLQTNHAELGGTGRSSAAGSPDRAARKGTRRNRRHEATGLITQRSLVQIQPAQRTESPGQNACARGRCSSAPPRSSIESPPGWLGGRFGSATIAASGAQFTEGGNFSVATGGDFVMATDNPELAGSNPARATTKTSGHTQLRPVSAAPKPGHIQLGPRT